MAAGVSQAVRVYVRLSLLAQSLSLGCLGGALGHVHLAHLECVL